MANNLKGKGLEDSSGAEPTLATLEALGVHWPRSMPAGERIPDHDYVGVTARNGNGDPTTIVYKTGGASGTTVATITLAYNVDGLLDSRTVVLS